MVRVRVWVRVSFGVGEEQFSSGPIALELFKIGRLKSLQYLEENTCIGVFFYKAAGLQLSCKYCKIFENSFFHKTPLVSASEKFINFPEKYQWQRCNKFVFLISMTE